jgi:RNA polymerase sigma-70 factor (ECF subfamily)
MSDFARLLQNEIPRLRRYARALTRDAARADDLVQSCLVRAIAKEHLWEPRTDLRAWLFTILHNQNVNDIRRSVREGVVVAVEDVAAVLTVAPRAGASLQLRDLERAIRLLPEEQRQVIPARGSRRDALRGGGRDARHSDRHGPLASVARP